MGRLEDIIARNQQPKRFSERLTVGIGVGLFLLFVIFLVVFTDLGLPVDEEPARPATPATAPGERRLDDVKLYAPPSRGVEPAGGVRP